MPKDSKISTNVTATGNDNILKNQDVYCICRKEVQKDSKFIGCENGNNCLSFKRRWDELKCLGGDWFHTKCIGLYKIPPQNQTWYCPLRRSCDNYRYSNKQIGTSEERIKLKGVTKNQVLANLNRSLLLEGRHIKKMLGDGNCLFRAMALHQYNDVDQHVKVRQEIASTLLNILQDNKYRQMWELNNFKETRVVSNKDHLARCMFYHSIAFEEEYLGKKESRYDFMVRKASLISDPVTSTDNIKSCSFKIWWIAGIGNLFIFDW